jgi:hypothetical protein
MACCGKSAQRIAGLQTPIARLALSVKHVKKWFNPLSARYKRAVLF